MEFDYAVVGGGAAGCVLAARLSEDDRVRVLLLDTGAGRPGAGRPAPPSPDRSFARGHRLGYVGWAADAPGWGYTGLLPYFRRSERVTARDARVGADLDVRGDDGPVAVGPVAERSWLDRAWLDAAADCGFARVDDLGAGLDVGFGWTDVPAGRGRDGRRGAGRGDRRDVLADAYLRPALARPNLTVVTGAQVLGLDVTAGRCAGLRYVAAGRRVEVAVTGETVLAAGAVGSAHLLLRSGIGPAGHLAEHGVPVVADRPEVGANLQDHPFCTVVYRTPAPLPAVPGRPFGAASGLVRSETAGVVAGSVPDLRLVVLDAPYAPSGAPVPDAGYSIGFSAAAPRSRGTLRLAAADPAARPVVEPMHLASPVDVDTMVAGLRLARRLGRAAALAPWRGEEVAPCPAADDARYVRERSGPSHHHAGTCRMGADAGSVVDTELRVRGVDGLRVADAAVLPALPTANPDATVLAVAERAAEILAPSHRQVGVPAVPAGPMVAAGAATGVGVG